MPAKRPPDPLRAHGTPAEGDDPAVGVLEQLAHLGRLQAPELLLAPTPEEACDRHPDLALQELVGLDRLEPRRAGCGGGEALSRAHEADEDERRPLGGALRVRLRMRL